MSPAELIALARFLGADETGETAKVVDAWVRSASPHAIIELATVARASFRSAAWTDREPPGGSPFARWAPGVVPGLAALLSTDRSGWVREVAVRELAEQAVEARLRADLAPAFARSLGVVELLRGRTRGGGGKIVVLVHGFLSEPSCREALGSASAGDDPVVRQAALKLLLRVAPPAEVLGRALQDDDARVRFWGARMAMSKATSDEGKHSLLPLLERSRSAWMRARALRGRAHLDASDAPLEAALLDHHTHVRYLARTLLRARHPAREFGETRDAALAMLARSTASAAELVGALGALADVGVVRDLAVVERFTSDPRPRVRAEAARTRTLLGR